MAEGANVWAGIVAGIAMIATVSAAYVTGRWSNESARTAEIEKNRGAIDLERTKFEASLILKVLESGDQKERVKALRFLAQAGLIDNYADKIEKLATDENMVAIPRIESRWTPLELTWGGTGLPQGPLGP